MKGREENHVSEWLTAWRQYPRSLQGFRGFGWNVKCYQMARGKVTCIKKQLIMKRVVFLHTLNQKFDDSIPLLLSIDDTTIFSGVTESNSSYGKSSSLRLERDMRLCLPRQHSLLFDLFQTGQESWEEVATGKRDKGGRRDNTKQDKTQKIREEQKQEARKRFARSCLARRRCH